MNTNRHAPNSNSHTGGPLKTQEVVAIGGVLGGGLALLISALQGRDDDDETATKKMKENKPMKVQTQTKNGDVHIVLKDAKKQADALTHSKQVEAVTASLKKASSADAGKVLAESLQPVKERFAPIVAERAEQAKTASDRLGPTLQAGTVRVREMADRMPDIAAEAVERGRHQADTLKPVLQQTAKRGRVVAHDVGERLHEQRGEAQHRLADVTHATSDITEELAKTAKELAAATKDQGTHIAETVRARFPALLEQVEHAISDVSSGRGEAASGKAQHLTDDLTHQLTEVREWLAKGGEQVAKSLEQTQVSGEKVREVSKRAASQTAGTTKDFVGAVVWASAAGGIVYFGLLNDEQRAKVRSFGKRAFGTMKDVVRDLQGDDADF